MKRILKVFGAALLLLAVCGGGLLLWASAGSARALSRTVDTHHVAFPIPLPIPAEEVERLGLSEAEAEDLARERALERGRHLVSARYACAECHGEDFGGGVMVDAPIMGRLLGPNLTTGAGSRTMAYTAADWDRMVRHGVRPDGRPTGMPSEDFQLMSDQELSDIVTYIRSLPPVDNVVPPVTLGPLGKVLVATGRLHLSADRIATHDQPHSAAPPVSEVSVEYGRHLTGVCTGCHGGDLAGGPIAGGDPNWAPARNLTPHATGLADWTYPQFVTAMRDGMRPDGTPLLPPMTSVVPYAQRMTDVEMEAIWVYLRSVPAVATR